MASPGGSALREVLECTQHVAPADPPSQPAVGDDGEASIAVVQEVFDNLDDVSLSLHRVVC